MVMVVVESTAVMAPIEGSSCWNGKKYRVPRTTVVEQYKKTDMQCPASHLGPAEVKEESDDSQPILLGDSIADAVVDVWVVVDHVHLQWVLHTIHSVFWALWVICTPVEVQLYKAVGVAVGSRVGRGGSTVVKVPLGCSQQAHEVSWGLGEGG